MLNEQKGRPDQFPRPLSICTRDLVLTRFSAQTVIRCPTSQFVDDKSFIVVGPGARDSTNLVHNPQNKEIRRSIAGKESIATSLVVAK